MEDIEITATRGDDIARNAPHARFDCLVHKMNKDKPELSSAKNHCRMCFCWVCDQPASECKEWTAHCVCNGSVEWTAVRNKVQRMKKAAEEAPPQESAEDIRARFAAVAAGVNAPTSQADEMDRETREQAAEDEENEDLFADYEPIHFKLGQGHPDPVVETTSLSFAELPSITYTLKLPEQIMQPKSAQNPYGGALSRLQLETVAYACQRHETLLPGRQERAGFFLGDGVGLGKGRQLAGLVYEGWLQGRKRHLWVSVSADLMVDSQRDLKDIGAEHIPVYNITKLQYGKLPMKEGVIFSTYTALVSKSRNATRLQQIAQWLGGESAEGCMLFDESHKAKNLVADKEINSKGKNRPVKNKSSKMALCVKEIQELCPRARVVYCSATGASSLQNMAYMDRLGLWGRGTAFNDFDTFEQAIGGGGVGAMELIALDMKRRGMYISRQLSFKSAEFQTEIVDLTQRQRVMYDAAAMFWSELLGCFSYALHVLDVKEKKGHPSSRVMSHYWGCHQRFFRQLCMAMKVPKVVALSQAALAENKCVIIGLQTTGEARLNDAVKAGEDLEEFAGMKEILKFLLAKFPTGDYIGAHPEEDLEEGLDTDDLVTTSAAAGSSRFQSDVRSRGAREPREDDNGDDLDGFIVHSDENEEEFEDTSDEEPELEGDEEPVKLPREVKELTKQQLRELLRLAKMPDQQCTDRAQLIARLKEVERRARSGASLPVSELLKKRSGTGKRDNAADKEPISKRLKRNKAAVVYLEESDEDVELDDVEEEASDAAPSAEESNHGLIERKVRIYCGEVKEWRLGVVSKYSSRSQQHCVRFDDCSEQWFDLKSERWALQTQLAPGQQGSQRSKQRSVVSDDDDTENEQPQKSRPQRAGAKKTKAKLARHKRIAEDSDSASDWERDGCDDDEVSEVEQPVAKQPMVARKPAAAKKPKRRSREDSDDESVLEVDEEEKDLSVYQHHSVREIQHLQALKRQLRRKLQQLAMPENPLDKLILELGGPEAVAELTGRKGRLTRDRAGKTVYLKRNNGMTDEDGRMVAMERINLQERRNFMDGKKLVAIISEAASSGISLQADRRVANTRRRVHITLELPWSADQCIQQCGRSHRSNQLHGPQYQLVMTACGGERRFASTVAKRLQALGALTKGDRRAADAADLSAFDVDTKWGRKAMESVLEIALKPLTSSRVPPPTHVREALGIKANAELQERWTAYLVEAEEALVGAGIQGDSSDVKKFLNRLLGMPVGMQNRIFAHFSFELDAQIKRARENHEYDEGVVDIRGQNVKVEPNFPVQLAADTTSSGVALHHYQIGVDRGMSISMAAKMLQEKAAINEGGQPYYGEGIYVSRNTAFGRTDGLKSHALLLQRPIPSFAASWTPLFKVYRPATGLGQVTTLDDVTKGGRMRRIDIDEAKQGWSKQYEEALKVCAHGPRCRNGSACPVGRRIEQKHVLTGAVLPYWDMIKQAVGTKTVSDGKDGMKLVSLMRIVRVRAEKADGSENRIVGVEITARGIQYLRQLLGGTAPSDGAPLGMGKIKSSAHSRPDVKPNISQWGASAARSAPIPGTRVFPKVENKPRYTAGGNVIVFGLKAAPQYNNKQGVLVSLDQTTGRWNVRLNSNQGPVSGAMLLAKPDNLLGI